MKFTSKILFSILLATLISCNVSSSNAIMSTDTPTLPSTFERGIINKISVSPNNNNLVVATTTGVWIYDLSKGKLIKHQEGDPIIDIPLSSVADIIWSPDGDSVAVSQDNNGVWVWDANTWELLTEIEGENSWQEAKGNPGFAWSPDGTKLALGMGGNVWVWDKRTKEWEAKEKKINEEGTQLGVMWTRDNRLMTVLGWSLFDVDTGEYVKDVPHGIDGMGRIIWSPSQTHLYFLFDMGGGLIDTSRDITEYVWWCCNKFSWSQTGRFFAAFHDESHTLYVVDTTMNKLIWEEKQENTVLRWRGQSMMIC